MGGEGTRGDWGCSWICESRVQQAGQLGDIISGDTKTLAPSALKAIGAQASGPPGVRDPTGMRRGSSSGTGSRSSVPACAPDLQLQGCVPRPMLCSHALKLRVELHARLQAWEGGGSMARGAAQ